MGARTPTPCLVHLSRHNPRPPVRCHTSPRARAQFHERVQLDSITHNELGNPAVLAHLPPYAPTAASGPGAAGESVCVCVCVCVFCVCVCVGVSSH
jgi:hypothetical protein